MLKDVLCELRKEKGFSQTQIAKMLNITRQAYNHYETGTRYPTPEGLTMLAEIFDVSVDYLLGRTTTKKDLPAIDGERKKLNDFIDTMNDEQLKKLIEYMEFLKSRTKD